MPSKSNYLQESMSELRKVTWPSRRTLIIHTILVVIVSVVLMGLLYVFDIGFSAAYTWIVQKLTFGQ
jgi:preprotein translocase SecE subunit